MANAHVAVASFPYGSHAAPLLAAVRRLAAASPTTLFSFFGTRHSNKSVFAGDDDVAGVRAYEVWDGVEEGRDVAANMFQERIELFMVAAPAELRRCFAAAERDSGKKVTCLVTDAFLWFGADVAEEMGVPWVPLWTAGPASLSAHVHTDLIRANNQGGGIGFVPGMEKVNAEDLPREVVNAKVNPYFSEMLRKMGVELARAEAVFVNSFEELDEKITMNLKSRFKAYLNVGPVATGGDEGGRESLAWLDNKKAGSVVYLSFGSVTTPPKEELVEVAQALEESEVPFVWSLREDARPLLPEGFLEASGRRGLVVEWAPQAEILRHEAVGVFVTHCGWNSVLESLVGGVPMIGRPFWGDQKLNGKMLQSVWEVGVCASGISKQGLRKWLRMFLEPEKEGKRMRENVDKLKKFAELAVGPNGSSTKNFQRLVDIIINKT